MPQTQAEFEAAYRAGWSASEKEHDYDPGAVMPDTVVHTHDLEGSIPLFVPGFIHGTHTDEVLGRVVIDGRQAIIALPEGNPSFLEMVKEGAYIGMFVRFPIGVDSRKYINQFQGEKA